MPAGRPTKYKAEYVQMTKDYIAETTMPFIEELAMKLDLYARRLQIEIILMQGLSYFNY